MERSIGIPAITKSIAAICPHRRIGRSILSVWIYISSEVRLAMFDVHVVGAGPAGSVCARECARKGLKAVVSEEHSRIGRPVQCSGLISRNGLDSLGVDYSRAVIWSLRGARIFSPAMEEMRVGNGEVKAHVVDRATLDALLAESAEKEGARVEEGRRVGKKDLDGRFVVGADGAGSCAARWFGFPEIGEYAMCMQADFENAEVAEPDFLEMHLSNERFPGFFGWLIPLGKDSVRAGMGACWKKGGRRVHLKAMFERFLRSRRVSRSVGSARKVSQLAGCIPMKVREKTAKGNVMLVGDAAGQVKATTGGGVVFGTAAARIAAEAIGSGSAEGYEARWRRELGSDLAAHARIRETLNSMGDKRMSGLFSAAKLMGAEAFLNRHGDMDSPTRMMRAANGGFGELVALGLSLLGDSNLIAGAGKE